MKAEEREELRRGVLRVLARGKARSLPRITWELAGPDPKDVLAILQELASAGMVEFMGQNVQLWRLL